MMNNIISIDLDNLNGFHKYIRDEIKGAQVPTPCTLTDAVEKYGCVQMPETPNDIEGNFVSLESKEEAQNFIENHLYKEEKSLKHMIFELGLDARHEIEMIEAYERELKRVADL